MEKLSRTEILDLYKSELPYGYAAVISKKAGVNVMTVTNFFAGRSKNLKVEYAILKYLRELREEKENLMKEAGLI